MDVLLKLIEWHIHCNQSQAILSVPVKEKIALPLTWTRDISDLVLLIYGCADTGSFNNGQVNIKEIGSVIGEMFGIEIKDISNIFRQIRKRKIKERTAFIDEMRERILQRMDDADNGIYTYKKGHRK